MVGAEITATPERIVFSRFALIVQHRVSECHDCHLTGPQALDILPSDFPEVHAAPNVIFEKGRHSYGRRSLQCN